MAKQSAYVAKTPDASGHVAYTAEEDAVWHELITRQLNVVEDRACPEFLAGLERLRLPRERVPQLPEVSRRLRDATGWEVAAVPALIGFEQFFRMLSERRFPAATFIRCWEELDYLQEPDIFHEIFGHTPLLMHPAYADFAQAYGRLGLAATKAERVLLARLFWFTAEFGLVDTPRGLRVYGAGILSSPGECVYALESRIPERRAFDILKALRTPYRIDIYQTVYYTLPRLETLFEVASTDLLALVRRAQELGDLAPTFPVPAAG